MNLITHIIEPKVLLLAWQSESRTRRRVAELYHDGEQIVLRYLSETPDYHAAVAEGFRGYPAFDPKRKEHHEGVMATFMRRLPPRKRDDFTLYLKQHRIDPLLATEISDLALLAYTGAKLPGDGFSLVHTFEGAEPPFECLIEACGFRYREVDRSSLHEGETVNLIADLHNLTDPNAIRIDHQGRTIGHVNRLLLASFHRLLDTASFSCVIERINGTSEHPMVYIFVQIQP